MNQELKTLIEIASRNVTRIFYSRKEILPMYHAIKKSGDHFFLPLPRARNKDEATHIVREIFKKENVVRYVFFDEAWIVEVKGRTPSPEEIKDWQTQGLSKHPDRREVISYCAEDAKDTVIAQQFILRPEHGPAKLTELKFDEGLMSEGRMVGLLRRAV